MADRKTRKGSVMLIRYTCMREVQPLLASSKQWMHRNTNSTGKEGELSKKQASNPCALDISYD